MCTSSILEGVWARAEEATPQMAIAENDSKAHPAKVRRTADFLWFKEATE
jgi:hypothetical protein